MATPVIMPRQGQSVESCIIASWNKKKGDTVAVGDILFSYETDKASFDEESKVEGTLLDIFFSEGDDVPCLTNVCVIGNPGESTSEFNPNGGAPAAEPSPAVVAEAAAPVAAAPVVSVPVDAGDLKISPRAKALADRAGVDPRLASASGPYGRVIERDVVRLADSGAGMTLAAKAGVLSADAGAYEGTGLGGRVTLDDMNRPASVAVSAAVPAVAVETAAEFEDVKLPNIRKVIAKAMMNSISTTCQLTLNSSFDASAISAYRKTLKAGGETMGTGSITLNDIIVYAVSRTLVAHKDLNANFLDDTMRYFKNVHIGIAVDTDRGLMVPTVFNANLKSLAQISAEIKQLASECQKGTISPDKLKGGSFTISNLGTLDIESFTPVLNPPQTGILGVNTIVQRPREGKNGIELYPAMGLSLTFDHRALDGAPAGRFLKDLKTNLENFTALLAK